MPKRMPVSSEIRWALAAWLLSRVLRLTEREASPEMLRAFAVLAENFRNDPKHETVPMKQD